jgi:tetratricopeptide (TPR) repeat protein
MRRLTERAASADINKARGQSMASASVGGAWRGVVVLVSSLILPGVVLGALSGCEQLDARNRVKKANRLFRDTQFVDAAAEYHRALLQVQDEKIHYNLGLAYSKIFKPGYTEPVLLGELSEYVCQFIPIKEEDKVQAGACVKEGDRHHAECGSKKTAPLEKEIADLDARAKAETDEVKKKELEGQRKDKEEELSRFTCPSSFRCVEGTFCSLTSPAIANLAAEHFQVWIDTQPSDEEIKRRLVEVNKELEDAKQAGNQSEISAKSKEAEELSTKDLTRRMMTRLWLDSEQHSRALEYWEKLLAEKPDDTELISTLAGIYIQAGNWRKAIELYHRVADLLSDPSSKLVMYGHIGNLTWSKLNQKTLIGIEAIEIADRGIGAVQKAAELQPKVARWPSLQASIFNFRSTAHGASWAAATDRATAQDLSKLGRVLAEEAKNAQQGQAPGAPGAGAGSAGSGTAPASGADPAAGSGSTPASGTPATPPANAPPAGGTTSGTVEKSGG